MYCICCLLDFIHHSSNSILAANGVTKSLSCQFSLAALSYNSGQKVPLRNLVSRHNISNLRMCENQKYVNPVVQSSVPVQ